MSSFLRCTAGDSRFSHEILTIAEERDLAHRIAIGRESRARLLDPGLDLSPEECRRLACTARDGAVARDRLVLCNLGLVRLLAVKYRKRGRGLDLDDLEQWGRIGLMEAIEVFDPDRGRLTTIAHYHILKHIRRKPVVEGTLIRVPAYLLERHLSPGRNAPPEEYRQAARSALQLQSGRTERLYGDDAMVDVPMRESSTNDLPRYPFPVEAVSRLLAVLREQEAEVIRLRFGLEGRPELTQKEIGQRIGRTPERVRQIQLESFAKLSRMLWKVRREYEADRI